MALTLAVSVLLTGCKARAGDGSVRVMTFNIRVDTGADGPDQWLFRKDMAASMIRFPKADIAGLQEVLKDQVDDLAMRLPEYGWFGVGRDDGREAGEYMVVFYRKDRFLVRRQSTFWLSPTPGSPSKGWDAACFRVVTWGEFFDLGTGKTFYLFNTHFDHVGVTARRESALLLLRYIKSMAGAAPVIVTGDFNSTPDDEPFRILTGGLPGDEAARLTDTKTITRFAHHGPRATFRGFRPAEAVAGGPIDFVFIKNAAQVSLHGTLSDTFDGRCPSDHMPVLAEISID